MEKLYSCCRLPNLKRSTVLAACALVVVIFMSPLASRAQHIHFERVSSNISDDSVTLSAREAARIERFISRVFPTTSMEHAIRPRTSPLFRKVRYDVVTLQGMRYIIAGFVAEFEGEQLVHDLAIFRCEPQGPNQVWRCKPWRANYYGLNFETAKAGGRIIVLFQEGGLDPSGFSISGVLAFREGDSSLMLRDLTPKLPHLAVHTNFPSRALFGQKVLLQRSHDGAVLLAASDQDFNVSNEQVTPTNFWKYNPRRGRFEVVRSPLPSPTMTESTLGDH